VHVTDDGGGGGWMRLSDAIERRDRATRGRHTRKDEYAVD